MVYFYILFALTWNFLTREAKILAPLKYALIAAFMLLFIHHLSIYPLNLESINKPAKFAENTWFYQAQTPEKSLNLFINQITKNDLILACKDKNDKFIPCGGYGYNLIYPAIMGACQWNHLLCHQVKVYDKKEDDFVPLNLDCWKEHIGEE